MIRRFAAGTAVATGLALSLTGCLGGAEEAGDAIKLTAAQVLGKAAEKTGQTDSFKATVSMRMNDPQSGAVSADGEMQYRTKPDLAYSMNLGQMSVGGQSMGGMEQVFVGNTMYMKMPMLTQMASRLGGSAGQLGAKPWLKISLSEIGRQSGINVEQLLEQSRQLDPVQNTKMLTASKDAREVGKETVEGVETTHYTGTYRLQDAVAKLPAEQREAYQKSLAQTGMDSMTFDLWVDKDQLPRKLAMKSAQGAKEDMTISMTYRDYGKPVQIAAPPADQVTDFSALMKNLPGGGQMPTGS
ncbi:LppX_LprAFG lipoprotein [Actinomadura sp. NPDC047616]|uniref:LppX_LprAFG lipoprotein n=1 Tax=Actinomadura sp. NPDC047616 TaxID=3155914 RepID=UPI0033D9F86D